MRRLAPVLMVPVVACSTVLGFDDVGFERRDAGGAGGAGAAGGDAAAGSGGTGAAGAGGTHVAGQGGAGGVAGQGGSAGSGGTTAPPFSCDLPSTNPSLAPQVWTHPPEPAAGEAVTIIVWSDNTAPGDAPDLVGEITNRDGTRAVTDYALVGGGNATYYMTFADLSEGDNCIVLRHGSDAS